VAQADESIRAFLAVELDDGVRTAIAELVQRLRRDPPGVSWTRPENIHLTLRFLGNVSATFIEDYAARLRPAALRLSPFTAQIGDVGAFPNARRPSVIWVGMSFADDALRQFQQEAERLARDLGLVPETRRFVPHITIGRLRRRRPASNIASVLSREAAFSAGAMTVDGVSLFSSQHTPQGTRYTRLYRLTFDGDRGESGI